MNLPQFYKDIDTLHGLVTSPSFQREQIKQSFGALGRGYILLRVSTEKATEALRELSKALKEIDQKRKVNKFWKIAQG